MTNTQFLDSAEIHGKIGWEIVKTIVSDDVRKVEILSAEDIIWLSTTEINEEMPDY